MMSERAYALVGMAAVAVLALMVVAAFLLAFRTGQWTIATLLAMPAIGAGVVMYCSAYTVLK